MQGDTGRPMPAVAVTKAGAATVVGGTGRDSTNPEAWT